MFAIPQRSLPVCKSVRVIRFRFQMRPLADVTPWGPDRPTLHWFALTEAWYWIEVGGYELFRYDEADEWPYVDYYAARLWEDVLSMASHVLEPVPDDLIWLIEGEPVPVGDDDACWAALCWYDDHTLYTGPLRVAPQIRMWRHADEVVISWRNPVDDEVSFVGPQVGRVTVPAPEFVAAVEEFGRSVISAMAERVTELERVAPPAAVDLDLVQLRAEHLQRATYPDLALKRVPGTDWAAVRQGAEILRDRADEGPMVSPGP